MRAHATFTVFALVFGLGCAAGSKQDSNSNAPPAEAPAPAPKAEPAAEPVAPKEPPAPTAADLPPHKVVEGDGITITEIADGSVNVKSTTLWNEAIDTTYQTCDYYLGALPVLKRQLAPARGKLLDQACAKSKKKKPVAAKAPVAPEQ